MIQATGFDSNVIVGRALFSLVLPLTSRLFLSGICVTCDEIR